MKPYFVPLVLILSLTGISASLLYIFFKKDNDEDLEPTVYTAHQTVIKMKIPREMVGVLIGRQGANIKVIQQESGARACFDGCDSSDDNYRDCIIYGTEDSAQKAQTLIHNFLLSQPKIESFEMTIQQKYCGRLIGRGGQNMRHIRNTSHAKIIIADEVDSDKSKVTIKGTSDQIQIARDLILNIIKELNSSREELQDSIQNRSPRVTPKPYLNGVPTLPLISDDPYCEMLTPGGDKSLEVFLSAFISPDQFWVQVISENGTKLDKLLDDMTSYYNNPENQELHKLSEFHEGKVVAAVFRSDEKWYRAEVVSVTYNDEKEREIEVFYVDYGDTGFLNESEVLDLRTDFLTLRRQAIQCFLAGVQPKDEEWSDEALDLFGSLVHVAEWVRLVVVIKTYEERSKSPIKNIKRPVPGVELFDTRGKNWINIGEELVKADFATKTDGLQSFATKDMSTSQNVCVGVPELSDSGSDIDGFYIES